MILSWIALANVLHSVISYVTCYFITVSLTDLTFQDVIAVKSTIRKKSFSSIRGTFET